MVENILDLSQNILQAVETVPWIVLNPRLYWFSALLKTALPLSLIEADEIPIIEQQNKDKLQIYLLILYSYRRTS